MAQYVTDDGVSRTFRVRTDRYARPADGKRTDRLAAARQQLRALTGREPRL